MCEGANRARSAKERGLSQKLKGSVTSALSPVPEQRFVHLGRAQAPEGPLRDANRQSLHLALTSLPAPHAPPLILQEKVPLHPLPPPSSTHGLIAPGSWEQMGVGAP